MKKIGLAIEASPIEEDSYKNIHKRVWSQIHLSDIHHPVIQFADIPDKQVGHILKRHDDRFWCGLSPLGLLAHYTEVHTHL